ncbi:MAG: exo-alpha-sialidase, partial [Anaerolineales bacterium]|nr:exo-alpha-sialidase [Anaerolineales bacterium]
MGKTSRVMQWLLLVGVLVGCNGGAEIPAGPTTSPALPDATATSQPLPATQPPPTSEPATDVAANPTDPAPATATAQPAATAPVVAQGQPLRRQLLSSYTFPDALSIAASLAADGTLYIAVGQDNYLYVARSTDGGVTFADLVQVSESQPAMVLPVERPAIAATAAGQVAVAWSSPDLQGRIWQAFSLDGGQSFSPAAALSESSATETILPRMILDESQNPLVAWLANSSLRLARSADGGASYGAAQLLDEQTCECCHPQPMVLGEQIYVAYRNLEIAADGANIRDIYLIRSL